MSDTPIPQPEPGPAPIPIEEPTPPPTPREMLELQNATPVPLDQPRHETPADWITKPVPYQSKGSTTDMCRAIEEAAGGRQAFASLLAGLPLNQNELLFSKFLMDPRRVKAPIEKLCSRSGLSIADLLRLLSTAKGVRAMLEAQDRISNYMAPLAEDVMKRALPSKEECPQCQGKGYTKRRDRPCKGCFGFGKRSITPSPKRQEIALKMSGLLKTPGGTHVTTNIAMQQNNRGQSGPITTNPEFRAALDKLLYPKKDELSTEEIAEAQLVDDAHVEVARDCPPPETKPFV